MNRRQFLQTLGATVAALPALQYIRALPHKTMDVARHVTRRVWYVSNQGKPGATGLAPHDSFATLKDAVKHAQAGDTVYFAPGQYSLEMEVDPDDFKLLPDEAGQPVITFVDSEDT